jgi:hypothetical protein
MRGPRSDISMSGRERALDRQGAISPASARRSVVLWSKLSLAACSSGLTFTQCAYSFAGPGGRNWKPRHCECPSLTVVLVTRISRT